jgi:hypothetical protein
MYIYIYISHIYICIHICMYVCVYIYRVRLSARNAGKEVGAIAITGLAHNNSAPKKFEVLSLLALLKKKNILDAKMRRRRS